MSRILTDQEFVEAQMQFIDKYRSETGHRLSFPLGGELREQCNREAQDAKTHSIDLAFMVAERERIADRIPMIFVTKEEQEAFKEQIRKGEI
jgi:hypothetical protein